ncbi:hypothetical protein GCM10027413_05170 [Conyzicola nivalis]|uniref:DUF7507 domain-containing protein n=1 Tax=Conyzicola nivalis TaxID=1477021 RepID=A0A916SLZ1_9MICO|nr:DUF11 domain-containing protein [Conyzicola nivalis]GGB06652.1 hypothetical protein GCM10010979_21460 [Conyzicola nivalis]
MPKTTHPSRFGHARRTATAQLIASSIALVAAGTAVTPAAAAVQPAAVAENCVAADIFVNSGEDPLELQRYGVAPLTGALTLENTIYLDRPFGDLAWNADETLLYGVDWEASQHLFTIDPTTGASTDVGPVMFDDGTPPFEDNWLNSLSATADGRLLTSGNAYTSIWYLDPVTAELSAAAEFPMLADGVSYLASSGDFLTLDSGLILGIGHDGNSRSFLVLFDLAAGTSSIVGEVPLSFGAAQSGGRIYLASATGEILSIDEIPTDPSEAPVPVTVEAASDLALYGATSRQDSGICPVAALTFTKELIGNADADGSGSVTLGDTLTYSLTALNTGELALTDVVVDDVLTRDSETCATVAPDAACVLTASLVVSQTDVDARQIINTGSARSAETAAVESAVTTLVTVAIDPGTPTPPPGTPPFGTPAPPPGTECTPGEGGLPECTTNPVGDIPPTEAANPSSAAEVAAGNEVAPVAAGALAATGGEIAAGALGTGLMLLAGGVLLVVRRRRGNSEGIQSVS